MIVGDKIRVIAAWCPGIYNVTIGPCSFYEAYPAFRCAVCGSELGSITGTCIMLPDTPHGWVGAKIYQYKCGAISIPLHSNDAVWYRIERPSQTDSAAEHISSLCTETDDTI